MQCMDSLGELINIQLIRKMRTEIHDSIIFNQQCSEGNEVLPKQINCVVGLCWLPWGDIELFTFTDESLGIKT